MTKLEGLLTEPRCRVHLVACPDDFHTRSLDTAISAPERTVCGRVVDPQRWLAFARDPWVARERRAGHPLCKTCMRYPASAWPPCSQCGARFDGSYSRNTLCQTCFSAPFQVDRTSTMSRGRQ